VTQRLNTQNRPAQNKSAEDRYGQNGCAQNRYALFVWLGLVFFAINLITRIGLFLFEGGLGDDANLFSVFGIFIIGAIYDLAALSWLLIPFVLIALLSGAGAKGRVINGMASTLLFALFVIGFVFESFSEFIFWNEFSSRFNFIAVDYLIFTREVIGNIQESYPLPLLLSGVFLISGLILWPTWRRVWRAAHGETPSFRGRLGRSLLLLLLPALFFFALGEAPHELTPTPAARELASNGLYSFFRAFRNNELNYPQYYKTLPDKQVNQLLYAATHTGSDAQNHKQAISDDGIYQALQHHQKPIKSKGPRPRNLVLVSIESLGSDYVDAFDGEKGLTPRLDALAKESLIFTNLYATGLRTVRGLEALSLSVPPTPGRAVLMREKNKQLQTLGSIFQEQGFDALYLYGGYSIFDNMKDFFGGNHYQVVDRTDISDENVSYETIWGVADEDLFQQTLKELDQKAEAGRKFFAHVMTTSNHRPYAYPEHRVSIPSHTGRSGAVQYTDWAIGHFIDQAKKRSWFKDTLFVFVADHTSHGRGRTDIPPENYRIPLIIYSPNFILPERDERMASQIDVAPTLLSLMGIEHDSCLFGQNLQDTAHYKPRAFMANYLTLGYMESGLIVELRPKQQVRVVEAESGAIVDQSQPEIQVMINRAISFYQGASDYLLQYGAAEMGRPNKIN